MEGLAGLSDTEVAERLAVCAEGRTWRGAPYHHRGNIKGRDGGVDCARILIEVFAAVGLIEWFDPGDYPPDWHLHRGEELYLDWIRKFGAEVTRAPIVGDLVVFRQGRTFSHGAICTGDPALPDPSGWPWIVHAYASAGRVSEDNVLGSPLTIMPDGSPRPIKVFSYWEARP